MYFFKNINILFLLLLSNFIISCKESDNLIYRSKSIDKKFYDTPHESGNWDHPNYKEKFIFKGNHRIVVELDNISDEIHQVKIPWRRRDDSPNRKDVLIVDANTNKEIIKKHLIEINNSYGHILFEPILSSKKYYFYYLPHKSTGGYYPKVEYLSPKYNSNTNWNKKVKHCLENLLLVKNAKVSKFESIDDFHSFFPMEIISTDKELESYIKRVDKKVYLFPEYRNYPIKMTDYLPLRWTKEKNEVNALSDEVSKGEYYTFQVGLYSPFNEISDIDIMFSDLILDSKNKISRDNFTCFNKEGIDLNGNFFSKKVSLEKNVVQSLWFGIQIPEKIKAGTYRSKVFIKPSDTEQDTIHLKIRVKNTFVNDFGDSNPKMMSRLRWLNSKIGSEKDIIISPYEKLKVKDKKIHFLGREIELNSLGLPKSISSYFSQEMTHLNKNPEDILSEEMSFKISTSSDNYEKFINSQFKIQQGNLASSKWEALNSSKNFKMNVSGLIEYDGMVDIKIKLISKVDTFLDNISFLIPMEKDASKYMLGLGRKGRKLNKNINWKWDVSKHQEGLWLGNVNKGLQYVLRDNNYERPLNTNFYQSKPLNLPKSWYNMSKGGIKVLLDKKKVSIDNYTGERFMKKNDTLDFNIRFLVTPFKLINTEAHFNTRFVHKFIPVDSVLKLNGTVVNVHHANKINPYINYPFYNIKEQKEYINQAQKEGIKVKLYNTIRELTYKAHELFPLRSLGDEIFNNGKGGGHSWLQEHLKRDYHSAWHAVNVNDASILNKGTSRWTNYYIEGINWLSKYNKIDGLYLDDIAFSRGTVKRIASVLNRNRESFVIDLHSANQFNYRDGFINSALLYMEHFPFVSRLWFGEYFEYDLDPDYWMTEVSGIPFGLTGEMLEKGGRPYRGLIYGMTTRVYHNYNPGNIWKLFDDFEIHKSKMIGYWVDSSPVTTDNKKIKCTIYQRDGDILITLASWSKNNEIIKLNIDWKKLGLDDKQCRLFSPEVTDLQKFKSYTIGDLIEIESNSGLILRLSKKI
tara:strand:- start:2892 stop:5969 length:3078 start_codon:yes stop_codon:yes gene_type:complete